MSGNLGISLVEGLYEFVEYDSSAKERKLGLTALHVEISEKENGCSP